MNIVNTDKMINVINLTIDKKYNLTDECIILGNKILYRIESLKDFASVKKGDKGGFVESEDNLSQIGNCWVYNDAMVYGNAKVYDNAIISDNAKVFDDAHVYGNSHVYNDAWIYNNAKVCGNAKVFGSTEIYGNTNVFGSAEIFDNTKVYDNVSVYGNARVFGNTKVYGNAVIRGDVTILSDSDYIVFKNWWSSERYFTWTRSNNMWSVGCFYGTGEELIKKAYKDSERSGKEYKRVVKYVESLKHQSL